ncbi:MAG: primosomal protein N' [Nitrosomonadaceae bacterium]|nr:primosomal protein N' [Nitrosomonadaceae bacterium]|tara:strand:- start:6365 stop:8542 length:2178 start_codon:yes stop_codon:yes gene_type:complete
MQIIRVALDVPVNTIFDYVVPNAITPQVGVRVQVPFGRKMVIGIILEVVTHSSFSKEKLKTVKYIFNDIPALPESLLDLFKFCSEYYQYPLGGVVMHALPTRLRTSRPFIEKPQMKSQFCITNKGKLVDSSVISKRSLVKLRLLALFKESRTIHLSEIKQISAGAVKVLKEFLDVGWVVEFSPKLKIENDVPLILREEQATVVNEIAKELKQFNTWLLYGITGSGKTEIYMRLIALQLLEGRQTLVLIPEINLTPQLEAVFRARFPTTSIISIHSGLSPSERTKGWLQALYGTAKIILGTRLSVFTPISNLGLIIVDEEQDNSFKQQSGLCYSARDLAVFRAKYTNIPVILGSATPSLESYYNAIKNRYRMLRLYSRAADNASLPVIQCIDTRVVRVREGLSDSLIASLEKRIKLKQQSLIFINRRGFAPVLMCKSCTWTATCSRCASRLVVHLKDKNLCCHYCGYKKQIPSSCPECGDQDIVPFGQGTQRIESALKVRFPDARILRIDHDSMRRKAAWRKILEEIHGQRVDILVGTQILAKGHNFPNLGLVGVLNSDASLYSTDFRSAENLFSQLIQVAGRAGRASIAGDVLIQTKFPNHPLYQALRQHDYENLARMILAERRVANFPPYVYQALLRAEAPKLSTALNFLSHVMSLADPGKNIEMFDPVPAQLARLKGMDRAHLLIQSASRMELQKFLAVWRIKLTKISTRKIRWSLDIDPVEF